MPTAAKLTGALLFGALAWFVSDLVRARLPGNGSVWFAPVNAAGGLLAGWSGVGRHAGQGRFVAVGFGLGTMVVTVLIALLVWSGTRMTINATRLRYDGPMEALEDMVTIANQMALEAAAPPVLIVALLGAAACGLVTEAVARRWS